MLLFPSLAVSCAASGPGSRSRKPTKAFVQYKGRSNIANVMPSPEKASPKSVVSSAKRKRGSVAVAGVREEVVEAAPVSAEDFLNSLRPKKRSRSVQPRAAPGRVPAPAPAHALLALSSSDKSTKRSRPFGSVFLSLSRL